MKRFLTILGGAVVLAALGVFAGCSDDDPPTGGAPTGDPNDPNYLAMREIFEEAGAGESWERSIDLTFALLDYQFPSPVSGRGSLLPNPEAAQDVYIDSVYYSTGPSRWHVWHMWGQVQEYDPPNLIDVEVWDSLQVVRDGEALSGAQIDSIESLFDIDELRIRAHFEWDIAGTGCTGAGHHSVTLTLVPYDTLGAMRLNASVNDTFDGQPPCISDSCSLLFTTTSSFNNVIFPFVQYGPDIEPAECPASGNANITAGVDLECTGIDEYGLDTLSVNGTWSIAFSVLPNDVVRVTFSNGTTNWAFTDTCYSGPTVLSLPRAREHD